MALFYGYTYSKSNLKNIKKERRKKHYQDNNIFIYNYSLKINDFNNNEFIICYDGYLTNKNELITFLNKNNYFLRSNKDEEIILTLYSFLKEKFLNYIKGLFSIVIYEKNKSTLFLVNDKQKIYPFFYTIKDSKIFFSNSIKKLIDITKTAPIIDKEGISKIFTFNLDDIDDKTIFKNIYKMSSKYYYLFKNNLLIKKIYNSQKNDTFNTFKNHLNINNILNSKCCILSNSIKNLNFTTYSIDYIKKYKNSSISIKEAKNNINITLDNIYFFDITKKIIDTTMLPNIFDYFKTFYAFLDLIKNSEYNTIVTDEIINLYNDAFNNNFENLKLNIYEFANKNIISKKNLTKIHKNSILNSMINHSLLLSNNFNINTYNINLKCKENTQSLNHYKNYSKEYIKLLENKIKEIIANKNNKLFKIFDIEYLKMTLHFHGENLEKSFYSYQELLSYIIQIDYLINDFNVNFDF